MGEIRGMGEIVSLREMVETKYIQIYIVGGIILSLDVEQHNQLRGSY